MKTQYYTASSLDGFIATENHSLEWLFQFNDVGESSYPAFIREVGALAMGSATYEFVIRNHIEPESGPAQPWPYDGPAWVFTSRDLDRPVGADVRFVSGEVRPVYEEMAAAAGDRNIWLMGGGDLVGQFLDQRLLDEVIVNFAPVILGSGAPLLPRELTTPPMKLISAETWGDTFVEVRYAVRYDEDEEEV